ncbi:MULTISPECIES: hypothetical protein [unclassified Sphingomonas]|uniref:hypothetical protein n=1 Tax=unclassified Sphingomonas TaxID=196159 RepID=UPI00226A78F0|nr:MULTISPECIES: hypothetical protein [unclassified Sphingomonas]
MGLSLKKDGFALFEVVEILATMFRVHSTRRETFISRIQQLQKLGLPANANLGRGAKVRYVNWQVADLSLLLELLDCGITPGMLKDYFRPFDRNYLGVYSMGGQGWHVQNSLKESAVDLYLLLRFRALGYLTRPKPADASDNAHPLDREDFGRSSDNVLAELSTGGAALTVNLTQHLRRLRQAVEQVYPDRLEDITFYPTRSAQREDS